MCIFQGVAKFYTSKNYINKDHTITNLLFETKALHILFKIASVQTKNKIAKACRLC